MKPSPRDLAEAHLHRRLLVVFPSDRDRCISKLTLPIPTRKMIKGAPSQRKAAIKISNKNNNSEKKHLKPLKDSDT